MTRIVHGSRETIAVRRLICLLLALAAVEVNAASINIETFDVDFNGWIAEDGPNTFWVWQNGELSVQTDGSFPDPLGASLYATNAAASGGKFVGNWTTARADVVGFDLRADQTALPTVELRLDGGTNWVARQVTHASTNLQRVAISMDSLATGGWGSGVTVTEAAFSSLKTNVQKVKVRVVPSGSAGVQFFYIDNLFLSRAFRWDGGPLGTGAVWMAATNWFDDGIPGSNSRVVFASTGSAQVVGIDSSSATGGLIQVGQMFCSASNRIFENVSLTATSRLQFNGYGNVFVSGDTNTYIFRNGASQPLELVLNYAMGEFSPGAGGAIIISNCVISETNVLGGIVKTGDGLLYLGASNRYNGGTTLQTGTVRIGHARALGGGGLTMFGGVLDLNGLDISVPSLAGSGGNVSDLSASGGVRTLTVSQLVTTTYSGFITNGPVATLGLTKAGTGTLWIASTNTWGGPTTVNGGSLLMTFNGFGSTGGVPVAQIGTSDVVVANGGTFGGFGRVLGSVSNNGVLRPGANTGLLSVAGNYYQGTNATITFQIGGLTATEFRVQQMVTGPIVVTSVVGNATNITTNFPTVTVTGLYNRLTVGGAATLGGTLRVALTNNYIPSNGASFSIISASSFTGTFNTNSFQTNNLPFLGTNREWNVIYYPTGVVLTARAVGPPGVYITDATTVEGSSGSTNLRFQIVLSKPATSTVTIAYATSNASATAGSDFVGATGNVTIAAGSFTGSIVVAVNGDTFHEADEAFTVNLISATNATIADNQALGTILNDDTAPSVSVGDASVMEGGAGTTNQLVFQVTLSNTSALNVVVGLATTNATALAGSDYRGTNLLLTIPAGSLTGTITVNVMGDSSHEPDETFSLVITSVTNATIADGVGVGTILNDDIPPELTIANVAEVEGNAGLSQFVFTVVLSSPSAFPVSFNFATSNGTAVAGSDYAATNATVIVNPGAGSTSIVVNVFGDTNWESNEDFLIRLFSPTNASILVDLASGTILNDEPDPTTGFDAFALQIGDTAQRQDGDDPDGDGYVNLLEYATGGSPTNVDNLAAVYGIWTNGTLGLRFNRNTNSVDVLLILDRATILPDGNSNWQGIATNANGSWGSYTNVIESNTDTPVEVLATDPIPGTNKFLRLRVVRP